MSEDHPNRSPETEDRFDLFRLLVSGFFFLATLLIIAALAAFAIFGVYSVVMFMRFLFGA